MIRLFWLILLFCVDIHVKADSAVASGSHKRTWELGPLTVIMQPRSLLEPREGQTIHLVKGRFFVSFHGGGTVSSPFANVMCATDECEGIFLRSDDGLDVKALKGEFTVRRLGDKAHYGVIAGAHVKIARVTEEGKSEMDFPESLPWDSTVKEWATFFPGTAKEFRPELSRFRVDWKKAVETLSALHIEHAGRVIASHEREVAAERARAAAQAAEDAKLRKLFREKNDLDVQVPASTEPSSD